jgi:prophage lambdaSa04, DNA polymerase|uniref:DNA polymerase I n=2 Tax=unclassified Caudoviricetes TaxID=2788787 RepID=A0A8S5N9J2_9CAUD|nr:MAG TPA: DNA polymerase I [Siphoviridae sp. ctkBO7]DAD91116.1 MAG TPA: DNA polymerase I [Siphoviridae sp. ctuaf34]
MRHLNIDIETYSPNDISFGVYKYCESEEFEILLFSYAYDFGEVHVIDLASGETIPDDVVLDLRRDEVIKHAYNAQFEITCLNRAGYQTFVEQWRCTMIHGAYLGYPMGLAKLGKALGLPQDKLKDKAGAALIRYFSVPCKPTKKNGGRTRNLPKHDPDKWAAYIAYNKQDVVTEMECYRRLSAFPVPEEVEKQWQIDIRMNAAGVGIDRQLVDGALTIDEENKKALLEEAYELTGLSNPNSRNQLLDWLNSNTNLELEKLTKDSVAAAMTDADDLAKKVLTIRKKLAKSSVSKYEMMANATGSDGRLRGTLQFYGANRTGRWAGRLLQVQNLPRNYIVNLDIARDLVKKSDRVGLGLLFGDVSDTLSQLIRTAIIAKEGYTLCVADFSAIEARVIAWLSGETWRQKVFAEGGDIYCASASSMFGVPVAKHGVNGHLRQKGKVAELALGYCGGVNALKAMGALDMGLTEEELPNIVALWRQASPNIVKFWYKVEKAAVYTVTTGNPMTLDHGITFRLEVDPFYGYRYMTIELPSGRKLFYPDPHIKLNNFDKEAVHFKTQLNNAWVTESTYGGKLVENITQAVARDCLALTLMQLSKNGLPAIMHIHDEAVIEVPKDEADEYLDIVEKTFALPIPWAEGLVLTAARFTNDYYMKD